MFYTLIKHGLLTKSACVQGPIYNIIKNLNARLHFQTLTISVPNKRGVSGQKPDKVTYMT